MTPDGSLIVVHLVDPQQVGQQFKRTRLGWPLHMTIASWFSAGSEPKVIKILEDIASETKRFSATIGDDEMFGSEEDIAVSVIANQKPCRDLHNKVSEVLRRQGVSFISERWMDGNYRAHVTHHGRHRCRPGDVEDVRDLSLVRLLDQNTCEVIKHFALRGR